jgi:hypothetical protein
VIAAKSVTPPQTQFNAITRFLSYRYNLNAFLKMDLEAARLNLRRRDGAVFFDIVNRYEQIARYEARTDTPAAALWTSDAEEEEAGDEDEGETEASECGEDDRVVFDGRHVIVHHEAGSTQFLLADIGIQDSKHIHFSNFVRRIVRLRTTGEQITAEQARDLKRRLKGELEPMQRTDTLTVKGVVYATERFCSAFLEHTSMHGKAQYKYMWDP